jgi:hypothetical protein
MRSRFRSYGDLIANPGPVPDRQSRPEPAAVQPACSGRPRDGLGERPSSLAKWIPTGRPWSWRTYGCPPIGEPEDSMNHSLRPGPRRLMHERGATRRCKRWGTR